MNYFDSNLEQFRIEENSFAILRYWKNCSVLYPGAFPTGNALGDYIGIECSVAEIPRFGIDYYKFIWLQIFAAGRITLSANYLDFLLI